MVPAVNLLSHDCRKAPVSCSYHGNRLIVERNMPINIIHEAGISHAINGIYHNNRLTLEHYSAVDCIRDKCIYWAKANIWDQKGVGMTVEGFASQ